MKKLNLILIQIAEALLSLFIPEEVRIEVIYATREFGCKQILI